MIHLLYKSIEGGCSWYIELSGKPCTRRGRERVKKNNMTAPVHYRAAPTPPKIRVSRTPKRDPIHVFFAMSAFFGVGLSASHPLSSGRDSPLPYCPSVCDLTTFSTHASLTTTTSCFVEKAAGRSMGACSVAASAMSSSDMSASWLCLQREGLRFVQLRHRAGVGWNIQQYEPMGERYPSPSPSPFPPKKRNH